MASFRCLSSLVITALLAAPALPGAAQEAVRPVPQSQSDLNVQSVPAGGEIQPTAVTGKVFAVPSPTAADMEPVRFRAEEQMTAGDRALLAGQGRAIANAAGFNAIDIEGGPWTRTQIECPALPGHLFVRYMRNQGPGDETVFTAAIARAGAGPAHVIPVLRRGYTTLFETSGSGAAVAVFNRIRREEQPADPPAWLGLGGCYAALAGAGSRPAKIDTAVWPLGAPPILGVEGDKTILRFAGVDAAARPATWTLTFDRHGTLLKAERSRTDGIDVRQVPRLDRVPNQEVPQSQAVQAQAVPQSSAIKADPVPAGTALERKPVPQN